MNRPYPTMPRSPMEMPYGYSPYPNMPNHASLVETISDCEATCEHMIHHIRKHLDLNQRRIQLALLQDCADICGITAKFIARRSRYAKQMAYLCATICEACGKECAKFPDKESQHCSNVCLNCAMECRAFSMQQ